MQKYAQSVLVFRLTESSFYLALDDFLAQLPILLLMLIGGVVADRYDRRRLLTWSQYVQAATAFSLAALVVSGHVAIWHILTLSVVTGCAQAFGGPAYQSLIPSLVPRRDLQNAIALNSTQFNLSRVLGPAGGTAIIAALSIAWCFFLNGISFFLVVVALAAIRPISSSRTGPPKPLVAELHGGLSYVRHHRLMLTLIVLVVVSTFLAMPILTLLPTFAYRVLEGAGGTPETRLSTLMALQGLGAITGALIIGSLGRYKHMGLGLLAIQCAMGLLIALFGMSSTPLLSYAVIFCCGITFMALFSMSFSIVQLAVPEELRGRVVSIYMVALRGGGPLGGLVAGALADLWSAPVVMTANGLILAAVTLGFYLSGRGRSLREI